MDRICNTDVNSDCVPSSIGECVHSSFSMLTSTLPEDPRPCIQRDSLLFGLSDQLDTHAVVVVHGNSNVGKTHLLAAYHKQNESTSIATFVHGNSYWGYNLELVVDDLLDQIAKFIPEYKAKPGIELETPLAKWLTAIGAMNRSRAMRGKSVLFILDGLDDIPSSEESAARTLFELLPLGNPGFRFLVSGTRAARFTKDRNLKEYGEFLVTGFTQDEAAKYLADIMPPGDAAKLYPISRGNPGYYSGVRRIIAKQGKLPDSIPASLSKIFEWEWSKVCDQPHVESLAAYLCFDRSQSTISKAAQFLEITPDEVRALVNSVGFLNESKQEVTFVHDSIKQFVRGKVTHLKKPTLDHLIGLVAQDADQTSPNHQLPELLDEAGRFSELIDYLSEDYILITVRSRKVARFVQEKALLGLKAASKEEKLEHIIRFGLYGANLDELYLDDHWNYRIQALVSIGEVQAALALARSFALPEDRLQALCAIGLSQKVKGAKFDEALLDEIKREHAQLDVAHLGQRIYDIAADLVMVEPRLALGLVKQAPLGSDSPSLPEMPNRGLINPEIIQSAEDCQTSALEILQNRIRDPQMRSITRTMFRASKGQTGEAAIAQLDQMTSDEEKIHFLRIWLRDNRAHGTRETIIRYALRFGISTPNVTPTPAFYIDIAKATKGLAAAKEIFGAIRNIQGALKKAGPSIDYYNLLLTMLNIEVLDGIETSTGPYLALAKEIEAIEDPSTRAAILAEQLLVLNRIKEKSAEFANKEFSQKTLNTLDAAVNDVLERTGDHYQALKLCLRRLARIDFDRTYEIVRRINTQDRRDHAYADIVFHAVINRQKAIDISTTSKAFFQIEDDEIREQFFLSFLRELALGEKAVARLFNVTVLSSWCQKISKPQARAIALSLYLVAEIVQTSRTIATLGDTIAAIDKELDFMFDPVGKIEVLYSIAFNLADYDKAIAKRYVDLAEKLRQQSFVQTGGIERCLLLNLRVTIRAFAGLIRKKAYGESDLPELVTLINRLPDIAMKVELFADLAVRFFLHEAQDSARKIVMENLRPLLVGLPKEAVYLRNELFTAAAPALYTSNAVSCLADLEALPRTNREQAIQAIIAMRVTRLAPGEPHERVDHLHEKTTGEDIREILRLLGHVEEDGIICRYIHIVVDYLATNPGRVTRTEREDLIAQMRTLIDQKLPSKHFVIHDGYKILAEGYLLIAKGSKADEWEHLISRAEKIPNVSDRVFVLAAFAELLPAKSEKRKKELLKSVLRERDKIPVAYDRGDRALWIADVARTIDKETFKAAINSVLSRSAELDADDRNIALRKRAVDMAYVEDEDLANKMVSALDDEPMRDVKKRLRHQLDLLTLQSRVSKREIDGLQLSNEPDMPGIFWRNLKKLNSGTIDAPKFRELAPYFAAIEGRRITEVYPILCFGIESCVRNYSGTGEAFGVPLRIFRVCLGSVRLMMQCLLDTKEPPVATSPAASAPGSGDATQLIVRKGEKEQACDFIRQRLAQASAARIYIVDPYFSAAEIDLIELLRSQFPASPITAVTSRECIQYHYGNNGGRDAFRSAWKDRYGDKAVGDVKVYVVGYHPSGKLPIHDRYILLDQVGIKIGGSWNGLATGKEMDLSVLTAAETLEWRRETDQFTQYTVSQHEGQGVTYDMFSM